jgi:hypothetical protein
VRGAAAGLFVEDLATVRKNLVLAKVPDFHSSYGLGTLEAVDPVAGAQIWESPPLWGGPSSSSLSYVDWKGDGRRAIAFGTPLGMYLTR